MFLREKLEKYIEGLRQEVEGQTAHLEVCSFMENSSVLSAIRTLKSIISELESILKNKD